MAGTDARPASRDELRVIELFAGLSGEQLDWLTTVGTRRDLADGTVLFEDGEEGTHFYVLLAGGLLITKVINGENQVMSRHFVQPDGTVPADDCSTPDGKPTAASQFTGELPMLADGAYVARGTAVGTTTVIAYDRAEFFAILARCPRVCHVLLPVLAWRIRSYERLSGHNTMLEGLGTLAAGLAHELNNPAAAVVRAVADLTDVIGPLTEHAVNWGMLSGPAERERLARLRPRGAPGDPLAAADVSEQITGLLTERGVPEADELALVLADQGFDPADLLLEDVGEEAFGSAVAFLAYAQQARALAGEVMEGSRRIANLVGSVKDYTNVGRAPLRDVLLADGIDATLTMMAPKLDGIRVGRQYADLPPVLGYPGELNQVWTNLIENAADAMEEGGELAVRVYAEGDCAVVEFADSGPGIPPEIKSRLFQPFFTTKDIGKGTGLGLHLSRDIVVHRHKGRIDVTSVPGDTRFRVYLPFSSRPSTPPAARPAPGTGADPGDPTA